MSNRIQVDHTKVTQAGVDLGDASNTISQTLGSLRAVAQDPNAAPSFGEPHLNSVFESFWTALHQQVKLSYEVFGELGKRMGGSAVTLKNGDTTGANKINSSGGGSPAPSTTTPSTSTPAPGAGGDNTPPPVTSAPPPPDPTTTTSNPPDGSADGSGDGTVSNPGSATPTDAVAAAQAQADQLTAAALAQTQADQAAAATLTQ